MDKFSKLLSEHLKSNQDIIDGLNKQIKELRLELCQAKNEIDQLKAVPNKYYTDNDSKMHMQNSTCKTCGL